MILPLIISLLILQIIKSAADHDNATRLFHLFRPAILKYDLARNFIRSQCPLLWNSISIKLKDVLSCIHTLRIHYAHAAANLNSGYSKYVKVALVHYFCTIALRTSRAVLTRACASRRVDLRERRIDLFSGRVIVFC